MALFGKSKPKSSALKRFRPVVVRTQNIAKELSKIAKSHDMKVEALDFTLLDTQNYTRMAEEKSEIEWDDVSYEALYKLDEIAEILNPQFQIKQEYEIEVFGKSKTDQYYDLNLAVGANATKCKVYLSIKAGSKVSYTPDLEEDLLMLINKNKARAGILVNIFDDMLKDAIFKLSARIRVSEDLVFHENETILIAEGYEPTLTQDDKLILHYDKNEKVAEDEKVDYSKRGFVQSVHKDELLIEYLKEVEGKPGRNCRGEYMKPKEAEAKNMPTFTVDETIKQVETDNGVEYRAGENGFISLEGSLYSIKTDMEVSEISFKTTGSISTGLDTDITLNVKEKDALKDAIGTGMEVDAAVIDIDGNVGSNARVNAKTAKIGGQTHKTSLIRADDVDIHVHKGKAYGKNVKINRLEHGVVDCDVVHIEQALGGEIRAKEIKIEVCGSYVKATASKLIEIKEMHSGENIFTIDPLLKKNLQDGFGDTKEEVEELEFSMKEVNEEIVKYTEILKGNQATFDTIKKRLIHYKKNGVQMPASFVKQYNKFMKVQKHLKDIQQEYDGKKERVELLSSRAVAMQDNILDARIINRDVWNGFNEIRFKLIKPAVELVYKPLQGSTEHIFGLVETDENQFEIQALNS